MSLHNLRSMVRPTVTWLLTITLCAGFFAGKINADQFLGIAGIAIGAWFGGRTSGKSS